MAFRICILPALLCTLACSDRAAPEDRPPAAAPPNVVIIYLDDLGYGDVGAYGATALQTPNMDALANGGVRFTNGYASSATCTPSRYALLTGEYPWRNQSARILPGTAPLIIDTGDVTIASLLRDRGYHTGVVGKWHLGLGSGAVDWNEHIAPGPNEVGFDYAYILAATQDRVPTVYLENGTVVGLDAEDPIRVSYESNFPGEPTGADHPELTSMKWHHGHNNSIVNGIPRIGYMTGGQAARWTDTTMADTFLEKAKNYVRTHQDKPFFLYYTLQQPHVPRTPNPRFVGRSGMGPRGDAIVEADWCIGEFVRTLREEDLLENTLIVLSSDNGPVLNDGYYDQAEELAGDHRPAGPFRGGKYSLYQAGTRVPFVTYWPGRIEPRESDAIVCQMDLLASLAALTGEAIANDDGQNLLPALLGESDRGRTDLILEASSRTALRHGPWMLIPSYPGPPVAREVNIELGNAPAPLLFHLEDDPGERHDLAETRPDTLAALQAIYRRIRGAQEEAETLKLE